MNPGFLVNQNMASKTKKIKTHSSAKLKGRKVRKWDKQSVIDFTCCKYYILRYIFLYILYFRMIFTPHGSQSFILPGNYIIGHFSFFLVLLFQQGSETIQRVRVSQVFCIYFFGLGHKNRTAEKVQ